MADETPYRVVDRNNQGWHATQAGTGGTIYSADYGDERGLPDTSYGDLAAACGPLRPVLPVSDVDRAELERLFRQASRKDHYHRGGGAGSCVLPHPRGALGPDGH